MAGKPQYYWDACAWIGLIKQESDKIDSLRYCIEQAQRGEIVIWTSTFTYAEVFKKKCDEQQIGLAEQQDESFEDFLAQHFVVRVQVDTEVGILARRLLRKFPTIGKPQDAIHVASACLFNIDELHTFDRADLLGLSGQIGKRDGTKLIICKPPVRPLAPKSNQVSLFADFEAQNPNDQSAAKK